MSNIMWPKLSSSTQDESTGEYGWLGAEQVSQPFFFQQKVGGPRVGLGLHMVTISFRPGWLFLMRRISEQ